jgi:hypothetical protein
MSSFMNSLRIAFGFSEEANQILALQAGPIVLTTAEKNLKNITEREINTFFTSILQDMKIVGDVSYRSDDKTILYRGFNSAEERKRQDDINTDFSRARQQVLNLNLKLLSNEDIRLVYTLLNDTLYRYVKAYKESIYAGYSIMDSIEKAKSSCGSSLTMIRKQLEDLKDKYSDHLAGRWLSDGTETVDDGATKTFPSYKVTSPDIKKELEKCAVAWEGAYTANPSIEDKYFLEEVVESYLPVTWKSYSQITSLSAEDKKEADNIFLQQLNLIQKRIQKINIKAEKKALAEMRKQVEFLVTIDDEDDSIDGFPNLVTTHTELGESLTHSVMFTHKIG